MASSGDKPVRRSVCDVQHASQPAGTVSRYSGTARKCMVPEILTGQHEPTLFCSGRKHMIRCSRKSVQESERRKVRRMRRCL